jgi:hypothetical protein
MRSTIKSAAGSPSGRGEPLRFGFGKAHEIAKLGQRVGDFRRHVRIVFNEQDRHVLDTGYRNLFVPNVFLRLCQMVQDRHRQPSSRQLRCEGNGKGSHCR